MQKLSAQEFGSAIGELAFAGQEKQAISPAALVLAAALGIPLTAGVAGAMGGATASRNKGRRLAGAVEGIGPGLLGGMFAGPAAAFGAGAAPEGHRIEGGGRGVMIGKGVGVGGGLGGLAGAGLGALGGVGAHALSGGHGGYQDAAAVGAVLGTGAGAMAGGYLGGKATQKAIGKPSWEKDKDKAMA